MKKLILGLLVVLMACNPTPPASTINSLSLSASPTLNSGASTSVQVVVAGTGAFSNAVNWSVSAGILSATTGTPVTFTAPIVSSLTNVTITATSVQDPSKFGTTSIKIDPLGGQEVVVALSAFNTSLAQHASFEITAAVT